MTTLENTDVSSSEPHAPDVEADDRLRVREAQFRNVSVEVSVWIGKTRLSFGELSDLRPGHVIELDQAVGAPVEIVLTRQPIDRGRARHPEQVVRQAADREAELEGPSGAVALPERHLAWRAGGRRHEHAIVGDLLDPP